MAFFEDFYRTMNAPEVLFERHLLAYVDILGWTEIVMKRRSADVAQKILAGISFLRSSRDGEEERKQQFAELKLPFGHTIRNSYFSDTVVFSCAPNRDEAGWLVLGVQRVCDLLLGMGHYTRGAIVVGDLKHDEDAIVGRALIEAHAIERCIAKYPRIIVSDDAADLLVGPRLKEGLDYGPSQVRTDPHDGLLHLDVFPRWVAGKRSARTRENVAEARVVIQDKLERTRDREEYPDSTRALNHRAKAAWMLSYLDSILAEDIEDEPPESKPPTQ